MFKVTKYSFANEVGYCMSSIKTEEDVINELEEVVFTTTNIQEAIKESSKIATTLF